MGTVTSPTTAQFGAACIVRMIDLLMEGWQRACDLLLDGEVEQCIRRISDFRVLPGRIGTLVVLSGEASRKSQIVGYTVARSLVFRLLLNATVAGMIEGSGCD